MSRAFTPVVGGLFPLGNAIDATVVDGGSVSSAVFNTRDLQQPGAPDFVVLGPGSQAWFLGWAISIRTPDANPVNSMAAFLRVSGSFEEVAPFFFLTGHEIRTPVYVQNFPTEYFGFVRVEWPAVQITFFNSLGTNVTISFQFWGKAW